MTINYFHSECFDQVLSSQYQQLIDSHLEAIRDAQGKLTRQQSFLDASARLRPAECDDLHATLRIFLKAVEDFEALLNDGESLLNGAASKRFRILVSLYYTGDDIRKILPLLSDFRAICLEASRETYEALHGLRSRIGHLLQVSRGLERETQEMLATLDFGAMSNSPTGVDYIN